MSVFNIKFDITHNADFSHGFRRLDILGAPILMTGSTLLMHVKHNAKDTTPLLIMSTANGRAVIDGIEEHKFVLTFPKGKLPPTWEINKDNDKPYVFDCLEILAGNAGTKLLAVGTVSVKRGVTVTP